MDFGSIFNIQSDLAIGILIVALILVGAIFALFLRLFVFTDSLEKTLSKKFRDKEYNDVIRLAQDAVNNSKAGYSAKSFTVLYYLAQAYEATGAYSNALQFYTEAYAKTADDKKMAKSIQLALARTYEKLGNSKDALATYLLLAETEGTNPEVLFDLAKLYNNNKNPKKARDYLEKLLVLRPGLMEARELYAEILLDSRAFPQAFKQLELIRRHERSNYKVLFNLARALEGLKKYGEANEKYKEFLDFETDGLSDEGRAELAALQNEARIAMIHLFIKLKDYYAGIQYVSEFLAEPAPDEVKLELIYLYANLLQNTGEEFRSLKNFERVYLMKSDYKDAKVIYERYKKLFPHIYLGAYFTSMEEGGGGFEGACRKVLGKKDFDLLYRNVDYYIYALSGFYVVFYRHIEPIAFSKLSDIDVVLSSFEVKPQNIEIYSLSGVREDAVNHVLLRFSKLIEGDEFLATMKKALEKEAFMPVGDNLRF